MRLALTEEQAMLQSSALAWLADHYDFRQREAGVHRDGGAPGAWRAFADMGWLGLPLPDAAGGVDLGPLEVGLLMQAFGRHLVVEPWHASVLQAGGMLALAGTPAQQAQWLGAAASGDARLALAHTEPGDRLPWGPRTTTARRTAGGWQLSGCKRQVLSAPGATRWLVTASAGEEAAVFLVDPAAQGVAMDAYDTTAGGRAADIAFDAVAAERVGGEEASDAAGRIHRVLAEGIVALGWEATGAMQAALDRTAEYTQQRRQFGQSLSQFQVVQHRLAEMAVHCAEAQAACELASMRLASSTDAGIEQAALVKAKVVRAARYVAQEAVQLHGAMGVCEALPIAATFRLLLAFGQQDGDAASHALHLGKSLIDNGAFAQSQALPECRPLATEASP